MLRLTTISSSAGVEEIGTILTSQCCRPTGNLGPPTLPFFGPLPRVDYLLAVRGRFRTGRAAPRISFLHEGMFSGQCHGGFHEARSRRQDHQNGYCGDSHQHQSGSCGGATTASTIEDQFRSKLQYQTRCTFRVSILRSPKGEVREMSERF